MSALGGFEGIYARMDRLFTAAYEEEREISAGERTEQQMENAPLTARKEAPKASSGAQISMPVNITISGMTVRETADVDKIAGELVRRIKRAGELMPNI